MGIVEVSRVIVREDLVGFADSFEFDICLCAFILRDFVGVAGESGLESIPESALIVAQVESGRYLVIRFLDLRFTCRSAYSQGSFWLSVSCKGVNSHMR